MATAVVMLGHQVASKAFRDAAFLAVFPATALPLMVIGATVPVVAVVPVFARLLERFGPRLVVTTGFLGSAALHALEWNLSSRVPWVAVLVYLHVAGLGALLLSGFWSMVSERFEPRTARASFGRIAAAGTVGGALGGVAAERIAVTPLPVDFMLLLLATLHVLCAIGVAWLGRAPVLLPGTDEAPSDRVFAFQALRESPHIRTIAFMMVLATAGAGVLDYLLKWRASVEFTTGPELLRFFAVFYGAIQVVSFFAQGGAARVVEKFGIGRSMSSLPAGAGLSSAIALLFPVLPIIALARGIDAVLRNSSFRSGYELLFVPMGAAERRRIKTFLDVTCDRAGEALGALLVYVLLFTSTKFLTNELLGLVIAISGGALWFGRRLDRLYLGVVEQQLVKHAELTPVILGSESGWTVLNLPTPPPLAETKTHKAVVMAPPRKDDPRVRILAELRSGDRTRVEIALHALTKPDRTQVAQVIDLLAWDDLVPSARPVLERVAPLHVGLLVDVLLDPATDFAVRRRIPRILGTLTSPRALDGLVHGLDDARFEVRYQCSRAIDRMLAKDSTLTVDAGQMLAHVERELSVPLQVWQGHRLIDQPDRDDPAAHDDPTDLRHRNLEHVFSLLATVLPREPLEVALRGIRSPNYGLRGLALEYLESVLPPPILARLWQVVDVPSRDAPERTSPEHALEQLRASAEMPAVDPEKLKKPG